MKNSLKIQFLNICYDPVLRRDPIVVIFVFKNQAFVVLAKIVKNPYFKLLEGLRKIPLIVFPWSLVKML